MASFLDRLSRKQKSSASQAKERLSLVLIHDRMDLSPENLRSLKDRLIEVISDYVNIDTRHTEIEIKNDGREQTLIANIPLMKPRSRG